MEKTYNHGRIEEIVKTYSENVIKVAFMYVKNMPDAEDIAQETFIAYMIKRPSFESEKHEKAWLLRVAINKSKNHLKSSWFKRRTRLQEDLSYMEKQESELLTSLLDMEAKYCIPLHMYYYEGYSIKEIAEIMKIKSSTIGTRLDRGRKQLKEKLGEEIYE